MTRFTVIVALIATLLTVGAPASSAGHGEKAYDWPKCC
jgi:hypothetical protein